MLTPAEEKVLKKLSKQQLVTRTELIDFMRTNGSSNPNSVADIVARSLAEKKYISAINPVGSVCYVITQKGLNVIDGK